MGTSLREGDTPPGDEANTTNSTSPNPILVKWDENEPANPYNWPTLYKAFITLQLGMLAMAASVGSSIMAPADEKIQQVFHVGHEVSVLCISLYM